MAGVREEPRPRPTTRLKKFVNANWVSLGKVKLPKGPTTFEVELLAKEGEEAGPRFDCFLLTRGPFVPEREDQAGRATGKAEEGYFPFEPDTDKFTAGRAAGPAVAEREDGGSVGVHPAAGDGLHSPATASRCGSGR